MTWQLRRLALHVEPPSGTHTLLWLHSPFSQAKQGGVAFNVPFDARPTVDDWLPLKLPDVSDHFFSVCRAVDPLRLSGDRVNAYGIPIIEVIHDAVKRNHLEGGNARVCLLNPQAFHFLVMETHQSPCIEFEVQSRWGAIKVLEDQELDFGVGFLIQSDTWLLQGEQLICTAPGLNVRLVDVGR